MEITAPKFIGPAKVYLVGGAVRDQLMGKPSRDLDYVVVGGTHELMIEHDYKQVGADFPVYLHPFTGDEYALARTERKTGAGYLGFVTDSSPDITLEDDLARRDLTINSMAIDLVTGEVIDPFNGQFDLKCHWLRHTSDAFKEDPVRILRIARFAARYNFDVHSHTLTFMSHMVADGACDELVPERVWAEMSRGLMETKPSVMFEVLATCGALAVMHPVWQGTRTVPSVWDCTELPLLNLNQRFALVCHHLYKTAEFAGSAVPTEAIKLAVTMNLWKSSIISYESLDPETKLKVLEATGAIGARRSTNCFNEFVQTFSAWATSLDDSFIGSIIHTMHDDAYAINAITPPYKMHSADIGGFMRTARLAVVTSK